MDHVIAGTLDIDDCPDDEYPHMDTIEDTIEMLETLDDPLLAGGHEFCNDFVLT